MAFLERKAYGHKKSWTKRLKGEAPSVDAQGFLSGRWGKCLLDAVCYEHEHKDFETYPEYRQQGPGGQVIELLYHSGHSGYQAAAEKLEELTKNVLAAHGDLSAVPSMEPCPEVWASRGGPISFRSSNWRKTVDGKKPKVDSLGFLSGKWGQCILDAVVYEHQNPKFTSYPEFQNQGPVGFVIEFLYHSGHASFQGAADKLEEHTKNSLAKYGRLSAIPSDGLCPEVWGSRGGPTSFRSRNWRKTVEDKKPKADSQGFLCGKWGECILDAVLYEHADPKFTTYPEYQSQGPAGFVIEFLYHSGHASFQGAAEKLEEHTKHVLAAHGRLVADGPCPEVWASRGGPSSFRTRNWKTPLEGKKPSVDSQGFLAGKWGICLLDAICYEKENPQFTSYPEYQNQGPGGFVIEHLVHSGHGSFQAAAEALEDRTKSALAMGRLETAPRPRPKVWATRISASRSSGHDSSSSSSSSESDD